MKGTKYLALGLALGIVIAAGAGLILPRASADASALESFDWVVEAGPMGEDFPAADTKKLLPQGTGGVPQEGIPYTTDSGVALIYQTWTHFDLEMPLGGAVVLGREYWEEGEEIVFRISSNETREVRVGIYRAEPLDQAIEYNSYGGIIGETVIRLSADEQEISVRVPKSGEYGFGITSVLTDEEAAQGWTAILNGTKSKSMGLSVDVNQVFLNPLYEGAAD